MMAHAYAPKTADPPEIYVRWTWVKELGYPWEKAGIQDEDIGHLASLINIKIQADEVKAKSASKKKR